MHSMMVGNMGDFLGYTKANSWLWYFDKARKVESSAGST